MQANKKLGTNTRLIQIILRARETEREVEIENEREREREWERELERAPVRPGWASWPAKTRIFFLF